MAAIQLILILLAVAGLLRAVASRIGVPHPVLLVIGGLLLALVPGVPQLELNPEVLFVLFIPPLLYWDSITSSLRDFQIEWAPIARLAVGLVLVTIGAVAVVAHELTPEFTWPAAFALGAIVAAPDPVAAIAVMRPLGVSSAITRVLEGEGLLNDATALVAYRIAVAAAVAGAFRPEHVFWRFSYAAITGIAVGLIVGRGVAFLRTAIVRYVGRIPIVENAVALLTPFAAYIPADRLGALGILAVVTVGLYLGRTTLNTTPAATRIQSEAVWSMLVFVLESLTFIFIGFELPVVRAGLRTHSFEQLAWYTAVVSAVVIGVRMLYVFPSAYLPRLLRRFIRSKHREDTDAMPYMRGVRHITFIGWAGLRGADSLIIALALPYLTASGAAFPARDLILVVTFGVIFATLVLQGLTLSPVIRWLGLRGEEPDNMEEDSARLAAAEAGLVRLADLEAREALPPGIVAALRAQYEKSAKHWQLHNRRSDVEEDRAAEAEAHAWSDAYRWARCDMIDAEREAVITMRDRGTIGDDALRRVQRDLDFETMLLDSSDAAPDESPYDLTDPRRHEDAMRRIAASRLRGTQ